MKSTISKIFLAALLTCGVHIAYASQPAQQKRLDCYAAIIVPGTEHRIAMFRSPSGKSVFTAEDLNQEALTLALTNAIHYHFDGAKNQARACSDDPVALAAWKASRAAAKAAAQASSASK